MDRVDDPVPLELHPHAIRARARIMSIRSSLAASMWPHAPRYFSNPSAGWT
jgi:hypothetical protein